ncbi:MAG: SRPBCC family protein [Gemmataceae bacterium]|nr:SRPBCC family protein [Gemmataceae bacterium]
MKITVETTVAAPVEKVWRAWTWPDDITQWNAASDDWHTTAAAVDLWPGGTFTARMEARDGSMGLDFAGTYTTVVTHRRIESVLGDGRVVTVEFVEADGGVTVRETFDAESTHTVEMQRAGWQAILDRFARYVESKG